MGQVMVEVLSLDGAADPVILAMALDLRACVDFAYDSVGKALNVILSPSDNGVQDAVVTENRVCADEAALTALVKTLAQALVGDATRFMAGFPLPDLSGLDLDVTQIYPESGYISFFFNLMPHHGRPDRRAGRPRATGPCLSVAGAARRLRPLFGDERFEREVRRGACGQLLDPVHDLAQRSFAWEAVGDRRSTGARAAHDAKPEQVEAVVDVGDVRLLGRERQAHLLQHELGRLLLGLMGLGFGAADQDHEVIREADHSIMA
jgi:hypothetical protein